MSRFGKSGFYYDSEKRSHYGLLILTAIVSVVLHFFLYTKVADIRFDVTAEIPEKYRETPVKKIAKFDHVKEDPVKPLPVPEIGDPTDRPGLGMSSKELSDIIASPVVEYSAPPVSQAVLEAATIKEVKLSEVTPDDSVWQPRQEIIKVVDRLVRDDIALIPRREIFAIERVDFAPDFAPAIDIQSEVAIPIARSELKVDAPVISVGTTPEEKPAPLEAVAETITTEENLTPVQTLTKFGEEPGDITEFKAVDSRLMVKTTAFRSPDVDGRTYFKLEVTPRTSGLLKNVPKDIVFVQDASNSLAEQRLYFCKKGLINSLNLVAPEDRFNVASFRDKTTFCFTQGWAHPTPETIATATSFINGLHSEGDTDLFESLKSLMTLPRDPARPLIVVIITDGKATTGITASTKIIGEFSKLNDNMSLFVVGTHPKANGYLLDMLSFCNRGAQKIVTSGRWDIPGAIEDIVLSCSYPVLGRIGVSTDTPSQSEIFPLPSANLYANKTLVYYGSCPGDVKDVVMQVRGEGGEAKCDCIFTINIDEANRGGYEIKNEWAIRKIYTLIGAYARNPRPEILASLQRLSLSSGIPVPYSRELRK